MTDYYRKNDQEYFERTFSVDPSGFLTPLTKQLDRGVSILDVGCGSGRDMVWLKNRGYQPLGFEGSPGLAKLAREASGCNVLEGNFETFDFSTLSVDAILLITALVHVPHHRFGSCFLNITQALNPGGWVLLSMKEGMGEFTDKNGRHFYLWPKKELELHLLKLNVHIVEADTAQSAINTGETIITLLLQFPPAGV